MTPLEALNELVKRLNATPEPDDELIGLIGAGELEELIRAHGNKLWPDIERLARKDVRFRRALASVWAYDSKEYERRTQLLFELGEHRRVTVRFVVQAEDFAAPPRVSWRAVEIEGAPEGGQLSRLLREIADWYERSTCETREVIANARLQPLYATWAETSRAVKDVWRDVAAAPDVGAVRAAVRRAYLLKLAEQDAWAALLGAVEAEPYR